MSYASSDNTTRLFKDAQDRTWAAERVGRTSGIVTRSPDPSLPQPADIVRFRCHSDEDEAERETTIRAGSLEDMTVDDLRTALDTARKLPARP